jgi:DNA-binding IclR family transcriptional regulator
VIDAASKAVLPAKSAMRALEVLEYFDDVRRGATVGEVTSALGYPQSSTSYLLKTLTGLGYLDFDATARTYMPTPRVALLGAWISGAAITDGTLIRLMREIAERTGQTAVLSARHGIYAQYIHVMEVRNDFQMHVPIGTRRLLVWSAAGFALLGDEAEADIRALVLRTNAELGPSRGPVNLREVLVNVATFRARGHFFSSELVTPKGGHIAMRLPCELSPGRTLVLGVSGGSDRLGRDERRIVETMRGLIEEYRRREVARDAASLQAVAD